MKTLFYANIKEKHDYILYNKEEIKLYDKTLNPINLKVINSGMGFKSLYKNEASYAEKIAKDYKAKQENRKIINDREHFTFTLYESTREVFKQLTKNKMNH